MSASQIAALQHENARLSSALEQSNAALAELQSDYQVLKQQLEWFKRQLFGEKSEKRLDIDPVEQGNLLGALGVDEPPGEDAQPPPRPSPTNGATRCAMARSTTAGFGSTTAFR